MNTLQKQFSFENTQIRTIVNEETVWFCFLDVCAILGDTNYRRTFNSLDEDEKTMLTLPTTGGQQEMQVINESGLYTILIRSKSEKAKPFRRWVTHDVLPTLRKQGYYACMSDEQVFDFVCERAATSKLLLGSITNTKCILSRVTPKELARPNTVGLMSFSIQRLKYRLIRSCTSSFELRSILGRFRIVRACERNFALSPGCTFS